ncbi:hypothetical protein [Streptomyces flaveolus]|uniref:hypothetical protein n=1 Tax=Streptomyces flaveolus TaxID=67297 RepID=UPI0036FB9DD5
MRELTRLIDAGEIHPIVDRGPPGYGGVLVFGNSCIGGDVFCKFARNDVKARCFDQVTVLGCFESP